MGVATVRAASKIDPWFLNKILSLVQDEGAPAPKTVYKMVDTCSAEFESRTPYYYSCSEPDGDFVGLGRATGKENS